MVKVVETYKSMEIQEVSDAPINNIFNKDVLYHASKLDFSQPLNYLDFYGDTLERVKENIDHYLKTGRKSSHINNRC